MIKKFLFVYFFCILLLVSFTNAILNDNLISVFNFDGNVTDSVGLSNGFASGVTNVDGCISNGCYSFDGTNDYILLNKTQSFDSLSTQEYSISLWINTTSSNNDIIIEKREQPGTATDRFFQTAVNGNIANKLWFFIWKDAYSNTQESNANINTGRWVNLIYVGRGSTTEIWINGTNDFNLTGVPDFSVTSNITVGVRRKEDNIFDNFFEGRIDEIYIWNRSLTIADISLLQSEFYPFSPTLQINSNLENTENYNNDFLNVTYNGTLGGESTDIFNCTLQNFFEGNQTSYNVNMSILNNFNLSLPIGEYELNLSINCSNYEIESFSTSVYNYKVDLLVPIILTDFVNHTDYNLNADLNLYVNFSDNNLIAYNISFRDINNDAIETIFATNITTTFAENRSTRVLLDSGNFSIVLTVWDSHTSLDLKYVPILDGDILKYSNISFYCDDTKKMEYALEKDKVKPKIKFNTKKELQICYYEVNNSNFIKVPNSEYGGHYIDLLNDLWIDENIFLYQDSRISGNKIEFIINTSMLDDITLSSIGDLNTGQKIYYYRVLPASASNASISINMTGVENAINNLNGGINMFGIIILIVVFLFLGYISRLYLLWIISGLLMIVYSVYNGELFNVAGETSRGMLTFGFIILGLAFCVLGAVLQFMFFVANKESSKFDDFNDKYNRY